MQTEDLYQAGNNVAPEGLIAESVLREMETQRSVTNPMRHAFPIEESAVRGLMIAVPMSLSLWVLIGLVVWAIVR